jgi:hypothetical protein
MLFSSSIAIQTADIVIMPVLTQESMEHGMLGNHAQEDTTSTGCR